MNKFILIIAFLSLSAWGSIIDLDAQRKILNAKQNLELISANSKLPAKLTNQLNQLRKEAINLSEIIYSRRCNSVSINSLPDETCDHFFVISKKFIDSYAKWNNSFFKSRVSLLKQERNFRKRIHACIEMMGAFLNPNMTPEALFPHKLNVDVERRYDTDVTISFIPKYNKKWIFHGNTSGYNRNGEVKYLKKYFMPWTNNCRDLVVDKSGRLEPRYLEDVKQYWKDSPYEFQHNTRGNYTGIYIGFKRPRAYVLEILVNGKVYKEVTVEYASTMRKKNKKYYSSSVDIQSFMYLDVLPKQEIRFQLGSAARHQIMHWNIFIDKKTDYNRSGIISKTFQVPDGDVEVRLRN